MTLSMNELFVRLKTAEEVFVPPRELKPDPFRSLSAGAKYLHRYVLMPILKGETPYSSQLDYMQFDSEDIWEIHKFYEEYYCNHDENANKLQSIYQGFKKAIPRANSAIYV